MTINEIIKKSIERLKNEGKLLTPDFYAEAFCKEAKQAGILVEDCNQVEKFTRNLDKKVQNELTQYRIKTTAELVRFLISKLNRSNPTQCAELLVAQTTFSKRVLQSIEVLHNKEAAQLAHKSLDVIQNAQSVDSLEHLRQAWVNFLTIYDDTFLQKLSKYTSLDTKDLKKSIDNLSLSDITSSNNSGDLKVVASLMSASFVPSIASSVNDKIANLSSSIVNEPSLMNSNSMQEEIKSIIKLRIALDKASLKDMVLSLDTVLDKLSMQLISLIERTDNSTLEIQVIKKDLQNFDLSKEVDFKSAHTKLFNVAVALESQTKHLSGDLKEHNKEINKLSNKVSNLEKELKEAKEASREDFLTKLYNKRALDELLKVKEGEFERYGRDYSLVMFDIDLFKKVNDTYGHDAGDAVLSAFAKILKSLCRNVDVVGRFGGEEFLAILGETDLEGGKIFAKKVNEKVKKSKFIYQGKRILVTVSGGVAERKSFPSMQKTLESADEYLYSAKENGRDRIEP